MKEDDHKEEDREAEEKSGLRKISGSNMNLEMGEKDNKAYITSKKLDETYLFRN